MVRALMAFLFGGALLAVALVIGAFGVPLVAGAPVLAAFAAFGALAGALVALVVARLRRRPLPLRPLGGSALLAAIGAAWIALAPPAPAVIVMVVDCLRADRFTAARMPRTFERASDAVRFTRARAQSSWTRSAMPSLLSGRYPAEHGVYRTLPPDRMRDGVTLVSERFAAAGWLTAAFVQQPQLDPAFGFDRGWGRYGWTDGRARQLNGRFLAWNRIFRSVPRFVLVHYLDAHGPYTPSRAFRPRNLPPTTLEVRPYAKWRATLDAIERGAIVPTAEDWTFLQALYDAEVKELDTRIDQALDTLEADGTLDASWFVLTADHGERFGEQGGIAHMGPPDETVLAVPLMVRPPGGVARRTVNDVVQHVDLVPTLIAAVGLPADATLPGRDLGPALRGEPLADAPSFAEEWARATHHATVRDGDWKLVRGTRTALYDLAADPTESTDVASEHPEVHARLEGLLAAYFSAAETGAWPIDRAAAARSGAVWTPGARAEGPAVEASEETMKALEALGYMEGEE